MKKLSKIKKNLKGEEKVTKEVMKEIDTIDDKSFLFSCMLSMIIEYCLVGNFKKHMKWKNILNEYHDIYKNKEFTDNEIAKINFIYITPFILSICEGKMNTSFISNYIKEYEKWANEYDDQKIDKDDLEDLVQHYIIKNNFNIFMKKYAAFKTIPLTSHYIKGAQDSSYLKTLKSKINRRIRRDGLLHEANIIYLAAYYKLENKEMTIDNYLQEMINLELIENDL